MADTLHEDPSNDDINAVVIELASNDGVRIEVAPGLEQQSKIPFVCVPPLSVSKNEVIVQRE